MATKVMISLPNDLATRMRVAIPERERSKLFASFIEQEVKAREEKLYQAALRAENDKALSQEIEIWEDEFSDDGLENV